MYDLELATAVSLPLCIDNLIKVEPLECKLHNLRVLHNLNSLLHQLLKFGITLSQLFNLNVFHTHFLKYIVSKGPVLLRLVLALG